MTNLHFPPTLSGKYGRIPGQYFVYVGSGQGYKKTIWAHTELCKGNDILDSLNWGTISFLVMSWGYGISPQVGLVQNESSDIYGDSLTENKRKPIAIRKLREIYNLG